VLLVFGAPCQLRSLAGQEHGRTIPLADLRTMEAIESNRMSTVPLIPPVGFSESVTFRIGRQARLVQSQSVEISCRLLQWSRLLLRPPTWRIYEYTPLARGAGAVSQRPGHCEDHLSTRTHTGPTSARRAH